MSQSSQSITSYRDVLSNKAFAPVFMVQFLGAFNDNLFKNAIVMLITFKLSNSLEETGLLITLAAGLFILPFFLLSAIAGQVSDRYPKHKLVQKISLAEVLIMMIGSVGLLNQDIVLLLIALFLMGAQSAFFGPIKYSILPEILDEKQLIKGNGLFSGSTFIAILLGTIFGGIGVLLEDGLLIMSISTVVMASLGYLFSLKMKQSSLYDQNLIINWNFLSTTLNVIKECRVHKTAFFSVVAISWFWFIGAILLSQIPALVKYELQADDNVVVLFLTVFSVGIAIGSGIAGKISKGSADISLHWLWLLVMSLMLVASVWVVQATDLVQWKQIVNVSHETLFTLPQFISVIPSNLTLLFLGILAIMGGMYIVPLYTLLQLKTPPGKRARMIAVNNIVNSLLMVLSAVLIMIGFALSLTLLEMFVILAISNVLIIAYLFKHRHRAKYA